jgi:hypothetical protein
MQERITAIEEVLNILFESEKRQACVSFAEFFSRGPRIIYMVI